jgi:nucleoside-diphosphate-sugar epimerase
MKKVLITGASGFIGSYLKEHLTGFEISTLSLRDSNWKKQPIDADVVIHCAGLAHNSRSIKYERYESINCELVRELLDHISGNNTHFILLSSILVLGTHRIGGLSKNHIPDAKNNYAKSKQCAEGILLEHHNIRRKSIIRLPLVIGENPKGNLKTIKSIARFSPFFIKIGNYKAVLFLEDLLHVINNCINFSELFIYHPYSKILSTDQIYEFYRKKIDQKSIIIRLPMGLISFIRNIGFLPRIFRDLYFLEGDKVD